MMTAGFFLRVSLSALLIVTASGHPAKGSKSSQQSTSGSSGPSASFAYRGGASHLSTPVSLGAYRDVSMPVLVQDPSPSHLVVVQPDPVLSGVSTTVPAGYGGTSGSVVSIPTAYGNAGSVVPVQVGSAGSVVPVQVGSAGSVVPVQVGSAGSVVPVQVGSAGSVVPVQVGSAGSVVPVQAGYFVSPQAGAGQSEPKWVVKPQLVPTEEALADSQAFGSDFLYAAPQLQSGPVLQSGETSSVVKEAELGNYQQQTEEFGYPADPLVSGQGFGSLVVPASGLGGYWGSPYPDFDYRLLYGLYPRGTYSTFSQHHEKGKDYSQSIHYLKEHEDGGQSQVQQKKVFQADS